MDLTTTIRGSLMEGFLPRGWDLHKIDRLGGLAPEAATARQSWWHPRFEPVACASFEDFDTYMGHEIRTKSSWHGRRAGSSRSSCRSRRKRGHRTLVSVPEIVEQRRAAGSRLLLAGSATWPQTGLQTQLSCGVHHPTGVPKRTTATQALPQAFHFRFRLRFIDVLQPVLQTRHGARIKNRRRCLTVPHSTSASPRRARPNRPATGLRSM